MLLPLNINKNNKILKIITIISTHEWNNQVDKLMLSAYQVFFLIDSIVLLLTICTDREFQIFTILLQKKCFSSFILKRLPMILKPLLRVVFVRSIVA